MATATAEPSEQAPFAADQSNEGLKNVAQHTLQYFSEIASGAAAQLGEKRPDPGNVFAAVNTLTGEKAVRNLDDVGVARARELHILTIEPAIARVIAASEDGKAKTYFIARGTPSKPPTDGRNRKQRIPVDIHRSARAPAPRSVGPMVASVLSSALNHGQSQVQGANRICRQAPGNSERVICGPGFCGVVGCPG
jgi:hypothetical protein